MTVLYGDIQNPRAGKKRNFGPSLGSGKGWPDLVCLQKSCAKSGDTKSPCVVFLLYLYEFIFYWHICMNCVVKRNPLHTLWPWGWWKHSLGDGWVKGDIGFDWTLRIHSSSLFAFSSLEISIFLDASSSTYPPVSGWVIDSFRLEIAVVSSSFASLFKYQ